MGNYFFKDPEAILDYSWDWTDWLGPEEVITTQDVVAEGVLAETPTCSGGIVTCRLSGGTIGVSASATCHITTSAGQADDRTIHLVIREG
jgi:hypothetical protein